MKNTETNETKKTCKPRTPRVKTQLELDAIANLATAKALARLLPQIAKLSTADQTKLVQEIARQAPDVLVGFQPDVANS